MKTIATFIGGLFLALSLLSVSNVASAAEDVEALKSRIEAMEKELAELKQVLKEQAEKSPSKEEMDQLKQEVAATRKQQNEWKIYDSKAHLAGYGAFSYASQESDNDRFNEVLFAPIFHYSYKDLLLLESELEITLDDAGGTETALEYLTIDVFLNDYMTLLGGKFLSPVGQFRQNLHPSWINKMPTAPPGFGHDGAAPTAEVGAELRGGFGFTGQTHFNYALYVGNGPELELNKAGDEIEAIGTEGFVSDEDGNKAFGGRLGFLPIPNLEIGVSGAYSQVALEGEQDRDYTVLDADFVWHWKGLETRGEYVRSELDALSTSVAPDGLTWESWYMQAAYRFLPTKFEAVARYTDFDSAHADHSQEQWALGINYLFASNAMLKASYEFNDGLTNEPADDNRLLFQLAYGF